MTVSHIVTDILEILTFARTSGLTYAHVDLALDGGFVERGVVPVVSGVGVRSVVEEYLHDLAVTERAGVVQGDETPVVAGVHLRPVLQEELHHVSATKT